MTDPTHAVTGAHTRTHAHAERTGSLLFPMFVAFLLFAPLVKAGNRPLPLLVLELAAIGFLFVLLAVQPDRRALPRTLLAALALLLVYPLLQMVPLPEALWRHLPGHAGYIAAIDRFAAGVVGKGTLAPARTLSVIPAYTEQGWLALLPPVACLLVVLRLRSEEVTKLLLIMVVFAAAEGLLGLLQAGAVSSPLVYVPEEYAEAVGTAFGTFVNRDHFAAFLAMSPPLVVGLIAYGIREAWRRHGGVDRERWAHPHDANVFAQRTLLFASAVLVLLCLVMTWSRAGIATALVGLGFSAVLLPRMRLGLERIRFLVPGLIVVASVLAVLIGITPLLDKLSPEPLAGAWDVRWGMTLSALRGALDFLPFGSGLSTLDFVFPRFQTTFALGVNFAHNDYAQAFMELGLAAPAMIALALWAYAVRMAELLRRSGASGFTILQLAAGIALLPVILHSAFDFALHIPAVAMWFATLAGVLFHRERHARSESGADAAVPHAARGPEPAAGL